MRSSWDSRSRVTIRSASGSDRNGISRKERRINGIIEKGIIIRDVMRMVKIQKRKVTIIKCDVT